MVINGARMNEKNQTVGQVIANWREKQGLSLEKFAASLNEKLVNTSVTRAAVHQWEKSHNEPLTDYLLIVLMVYNDWRMEMAIDCLTAKLPEVFERDKNGALTTLKSGVIKSNLSEAQKIQGDS